MRRAFNPYRVHRVRFESPLGVVEAARALAATDKTRLGRGLHACQLRVQVDGANVLIDPLSANVSFTSGQERLFRGTLQPNSDGVGTVLVGGFSLFWMARLIFFPVSLFGGAGVAAAAICHSSLLLGLMAALFLYWASTYVVPRLMPVDVSRYEVMTRAWLAELLRDDRPAMRPDHLRRS